MSYKEAKFYFMSGTGNSYRVACWMNEIAKEQDLESAVYPINMKKRARPTFDSRTLLGFIMPTHGFTAPWYMIRFALNFKKSTGTHLVIMSTRGGTKIGPLFIPGFQGTAGYLIALIMCLKGFKVRGVIGIDMPSNWTSLHWGLSSNNVTKILGRAKIKVLTFAKKIFSGKKCFNGLIELLFGLLLMPVSILYLLLGHLILAKLFFASNRCNGCGICTDNCMVRAIKMYKKKPYWTFKCESCMRCMNYCPNKAVEVSHPLAVGFYFVSVTILGNLLVNLDFLGLMVRYLFTIGAVYIAYWVFHLLNIIPLISRMFSVTTLTHYYRRYHEPQTKLSDINDK